MNIKELHIEANFDRGDYTETEGVFQVLSLIGITEEGKKIDLTSKIEEDSLFHSGEHIRRKLELDSDVNIKFI